MWKSREKKLCTKSSYEKEFFVLCKMLTTFAKKFVIGGTLCCPITLNDPIVHPVYLFGNLFEEQAIKEWVKRNNSCPLTRQECTLDDIVTLSEFYKNYQNLKQDVNALKKELCRVKFELQNKYIECRELKKKLPSKKINPENWKALSYSNF